MKIGIIFVDNLKNYFIIRGCKIVDNNKRIVDNNEGMVVQ